ncbi:MAG: hypothetical protein ACUVS6_02975 [Anaerolineae bacterium]
MGRGPGQEEAAIVEQAGLPANLIQSALALVAGKLLADRRGVAGSTASGQIESKIGGAVSLTDLLETMRNQGAVEESRLHASGLPQELAAKTGIDLPQAIRAIQAILAFLTGRSSAKSTRKSGTARGAGSQGAAKPAGRAPRAKTEEPTAKPAGRARRTGEDEPKEELDNLLG